MTIKEEQDQSMGLRIRMREHGDGIGVWLFRRDPGAYGSDSRGTLVALPIETEKSVRVKREGEPYGEPTFLITHRSLKDFISNASALLQPEPDVRAAPIVEPELAKAAPVESKSKDSFWVVWLAVALSILIAISRGLK